MTTPITQLELDAKQWEVRRQELELERAKVFIDFAKFGFSGTLFAATAGMVLVLALALLTAFTPFKIETPALLVLIVSIVAGTVAFGFLSLWEIPKIAAKLQSIMEASIGGERK